MKPDNLRAGLTLHINRLSTPSHAVAANLSLHVPAGAILTIMGASGSGKSSVLAAIAGTLGCVSEGLSPLTFDGSVQLNGQDITHTPTHLRGVGLVFQDALLFPQMTVGENLLFAVPKIAANGEKLTRLQRQQRVQQALRDANLLGNTADFEQRDPSTLSGGERSRVALMRALLAQPQALLLDEPFSKLDAALRSQLRPWVFAYLREKNIPVILVTHDAQDIADPDFVLTL